MWNAYHLIWTVVTEFPFFNYKEIVLFSGCVGKNNIKNKNGAMLKNNEHLGLFMYTVIYLIQINAHLKM